MRRTLEVEITKAEADALDAEGFEVREYNGWPHTQLDHRAKMNADERNALMLKRGVFGTYPRAWTRSSDVYRQMSQRHAQLEAALPEGRLAVVLRSKSWAGSTVEEQRDFQRGGAKLYVLRHKSGAVLKLYAEVV